MKTLFITLSLRSENNARKKVMNQRMVLEEGEDSCKHGLTEVINDNSFERCTFRKEQEKFMKVLTLTKPFSR